MLPTLMWTIAYANYVFLLSLLLEILQFREIRENFSNNFFTKWIKYKVKGDRQKKEKIELSKVNEVDPNSNQKNRICPSSSSCYYFPIVIIRHLLYNFSISLYWPNNKEMQFNVTVTIWYGELFVFDVKSSSQVLIYRCESCVRGDIGQQQIK